MVCQVFEKNAKKFLDQKCASPKVTSSSGKEIEAKKSEPQLQNTESQFHKSETATTTNNMFENIPNGISEQYAALEKENMELKK